MSTSHRFYLRDAFGLANKPLMNNPVGSAVVEGPAVPFPTGRRVGWGRSALLELVPVSLASHVDDRVHGAEPGDEVRNRAPALYRHARGDHALAVATLGFDTLRSHLRRDGCRGPKPWGRDRGLDGKRWNLAGPT
jgi:hypothetical protein